MSLFDKRLGFDLPLISSDIRTKENKGDTNMLKEFAWNAFTKTGSIDAYVFYRELDGKGRHMDNERKAEEEVVIGN
jgi:hypothetical protein